MRRTLLTFLPFLLAASVLAQPSATLRPSLLASGTAQTSYSTRSDVTHGGAKLGDLSIAQFELSVSGRRAGADRTVWLYGFAFLSHELQAGGALPLPERLAELSLNLGWQRELAPRWSAGIYGRPGLYGDFDRVDSDSFNVPLLALINYTVRPELAWSFGINANGFSERVALPVAGVRWQFAPDWTFSVGYPRSGFNWRLRPGLNARAGVQFQGGSFRVTEGSGVPRPGVARLANTLLDYREIRVGVGLDAAVSPEVTVVVELGAVTDRKFDYFDRGYRLDSDLGVFGGVSLRTRF